MNRKDYVLFFCIIFFGLIVFFSITGLVFISQKVKEIALWVIFGVSLVGMLGIPLCIPARKPTTKSERSERADNQ